MCPSKRIYCPKYGGKHENCETTIFKCINCTKNHMALNRQCPKYIKEKKLWEIMAEFNVSYRKAMAMYVPPEKPTYVPTQSPMPHLDNLNKMPQLPEPIPETTNKFFSSILPVQENSTPVIYAQAASSSPINKNKLDSRGEKSVRNDTTEKIEKRRIQEPNLEEYIHDGNMSTESESSLCDQPVSEQNKKKNRNVQPDIPFFNLLSQLKSFISNESNEPLKSRIENVVHLFFEWIITWIFKHISNLSFLQNLLDGTSKKADWVKYRQVIEEECAHFEISSNPQEAYDDFITLLFKAAEASIPFVKICLNLKANFIHKPYWPPDLSHAVAERRLALKTFRQNATPANLNRLQEKTRKDGGNFVRP
ncbi:unnamed protein product [Parnassius apollo]|uniref:(apollo) hypothetical protein n=1 Tax=Parnassius apollo TaxID=110799 RepID=A0A8S3WA48_PARAO|nr:unnamed protein product [Parnassius apollo]